MSLERLGHSIRTFEPELELLIQQQQDKQATWVDCSKRLLETAKTALADCNPELENLKNPVKVTDVVRAKRVLDEHQDNVYHKLAILRWRLSLLSIISVVALVVWLGWPPLSPCVTSVSTAAGPDATCLPPRQLWFAVMLAGVLGAIVSGFSSSIGSDQKKSRIPEEVSASIITFARFSLAMVSAVAISIFLLSGILNLSKPPPSFELLLAAGFVSGFSERLLMRSIDTLLK